MDFDQAFNAHMEWKIKLRAAIVAKSQLDAEAISRDDRCPLGQWLHGEAKQKYSQLVSYKDCMSAHAKFHAEAGRVARLINDRRYEDAEAAVRTGTPYASASTTAGAAITKLQRESTRGRAA